MKQVKVTIKGDIIALDYCSTTLYSEDEDFFGNYYLCCGWEKLDAMWIDDKEENVIKQKGKYIKTKEFFHHLFREEGDHPLPIECHTRVYYNQEISYIIELQDDEEFDIKKVQLVKSLEIPTDIIPFWIIADYILYDNKEIDTDETDDYCPEEKLYDTFIIENLY